MTRVLRPVTIRGIMYRVLRLDRSARGPRFLLRNEAGQLFGLYELGANASRMYAAPLGRDTVNANPLKCLEFVDTDDGLETQRYGRWIQDVRRLLVPPRSA